MHQCNCDSETKVAVISGLDRGWVREVMGFWDMWQNKTARWGFISCEVEKNMGTVVQNRV